MSDVGAPQRAHRTPGVVVEWLDAPPQREDRVRTDVCGFVGIAARGPLHTPVRIERWGQFTSVFGGHTPQGFLAYAVDAFFVEGGRTCWVVRVADPDRARTATATLRDDLGGTAVVLRASSPGTWGDGLAYAVERRLPDRFTLRLRLGTDTEVWRELRADPGHPQAAARLLNDLRSGSRLVTVEVAGDAVPAAAAGWLSGGADGLATLGPRHFAGSHPPSRNPWGLAALQAVDEVALVAVPDVWPKPAAPEPPPRPRPRPRCDDPRAADPAGASAPPPVLAAPPEQSPALADDDVADLQQEIVVHCETLRDRVALLDAPPGATPEDALRWRDRLHPSSYAALYHPWTLVPDPLGRPGDVRAVPPSGHAAGICARVDRLIGVHSPPANQLLEAAVDLVARLDDAAHGDLNDGGVNVIRAVSGRGLRIMGARTLSRDPAWRELNVRRLLLMLEETIASAVAWTAFEPNAAALWGELDRVARGALDAAWRDGMLDGASPLEAFTVVCDASNNPPREVEQGYALCLVTLRPPPPAEVVVVRILRTPTGVEVREGAGHG